MPFIDSLDVANRALQHCGARKIVDVNEDTNNNNEIAFAYDKVRRAELRRNVWRFAVRKAVLRAVDTDTMILVPALYDNTKTYLPGAIVSDENNQAWISVMPGNRNNPPNTTNVWDMYFGPLTVYAWSSGTTYFSGELVYKAGAVAGTYAIFMSLINSNSDTPDVSTAYDATATYHGDAVVSYSGSRWRSLIELNTGITPTDGPLNFDIDAVYSSGQTATGSNHLIYTSQVNSNVGNDPTTDDGTHWLSTGVVNAWSRVPQPDNAANSWRVIDATMQNLIFAYPVGSGPASNSDTRNVFRLPSGFLREAPQDAKAGSNSALGAPTGLAYNDWEYEGDYIVSSRIDPIVYRFVADVTKVSAMDDMFCEGLACRIAESVCEQLTQSTQKLQQIMSEYRLFMGEARIANAIEEGPVEPPEDDWVSCRA